MVKCPFTFLRGPHQRHSRILAEYGERSYNRRFHAPVVLDVLLRGISHYAVRPKTPLSRQA